MLFSDITSSITRERAELMRDLEYIREDVNDTPLQESLLIFESCGNGLQLESDIIPDDEKTEIKECIDNLPDDPEDRETEIERIIQCPNDQISLDEVMGIQSTDDPSPLDILEDCVDDDNEIL